MRSIPTRILKLALWPALATAIVAIVFAATSLAAPAASAQTLPREGIFEGCNFNVELSVCEQRLRVMHAGGIKVVVTSLEQPGASLDSISAYARYANSLGISVMWELGDAGFWGGTPNDGSVAAGLPEFSSACGCSDPTALLSYTVRWLAALPNTYGFYAADDSNVTPSEIPALTAYVRTIRSADPGHMVMIGASASQGTKFAPTGATLGDELYPVFDSQVMPVAANGATWQWLQQSVTSFQRSATKHHIASAYILQAFTFGDNLDDGEAVGVCTPDMSQQGCYSLLDYPNRATQLQLRNEVVEHSRAALILWYNFSQTYGQVGDDSFNTYPVGAAATARWASLTSVIKAARPNTLSARARARARAREKAHARAARKARARAARAGHRAPARTHQRRA
jgi:hypothetical protein